MNRMPSPNHGARHDTNVYFLHRVVERTELDLDVAPRTDDSYPVVNDVPEQPSLLYRFVDNALFVVIVVAVLASLSAWLHASWGLWS